MIQQSGAEEPIIVVNYDPAWPLAFEQERAQIAAALGEWARAIEHIGSTSVPGLRAKPVIDILVAVDRLDRADEYAARLAPLGYVYRPHDDDDERLFFRKGTPRSHHLHMVVLGGSEHVRHVRFRDILRAEPETARDYAALKDALAAQFRDQREAYVDGKTEFVTGVLAHAENEDRRE
jgi:GrpB-like predicted nucleotidyltransferase (UPF0157 family)